MTQAEGATRDGPMQGLLFSEAEGKRQEPSAYAQLSNSLPTPI